jgi:hypothetical protein
MIIGSSIKLTPFQACTLLALVLQKKKKHCYSYSRLIRDGQTSEDERCPESRASFARPIWNSASCTRIKFLSTEKYNTHIPFYFPSYKEVDKRTKQLQVISAQLLSSSQKPHLVQDP